MQNPQDTTALSEQDAIVDWSLQPKNRKHGTPWRYKQIRCRQPHTP